MSSPSPVVNRRYFLRAAGVTLALPLLESLSSRGFGAGAAVGVKAGAPLGGTRPRRLVCIGNQLGFYAAEFFPQRTGRDYDFPKELQPLKPHQADYTIFSGLD